MTVMRRAITLPGVKPVGPYQHRFIYRYCYGVVEPLQGDHFFVTAPQVNTVFFEFMLQEFAQHQPEIFKILFVDKAGYHLTKTLKIPENMRLVYLPSSNPELNPVERLWRDMKDQVAFHNFATEQELEAWIIHTTSQYSKQQIASLTGFPYILKAVRDLSYSMEYG